MLWIYDHYKYFNSFSAGVVFIRQNRRCVKERRESIKGQHRVVKGLLRGIKSNGETLRNDEAVQKRYNEALKGDEKVSNAMERRYRDMQRCQKMMSKS